MLPDVVEALVAVGRLDEAEAVLQQLEQQAAALEHRWATPAAVRCRALVLLAHERADEAAAAAEQAAAAFAEIGFPLDRARALLVAGAAKRRAGQRRKAADSLASAIEILDELGAPLWVERAEDELRRASPRPRRDRELTSAERRVAALVAQGMTNREVAAQLFTTVGDRRGPSDADLPQARPPFSNTARAGGGRRDTPARELTCATMVACEARFAMRRAATSRSRTR